jgi:CPA1 family monovalent cation:H+ antiporter
VPHFPPIVLAIAFAAVVVAVTAIARQLPVPPPILQVIAGFLVGLVPGVAIPQLDADLVFFVFLPPVLWAAAFFTSIRDFNANRRAIGLLAIGLVLATTAAVAFAGRMLFPGMPWAVAVALGAIVSPPDAVAAAAIVSRLPVPRRVVVVLEGESLVNDASALIIYRTAVAAAVTGTFSWGESIVRFFLDSGVGVLIGMLVAWVVLRLLRWSHDAMAETLLTLAAPYVAWLTAESLHVSAVLATVAGGIYLRRHFSSAVAPMSRLNSRSVWELVVFVLNAAIFLMLGMQFRALLAAVPSGTMVRLLRDGMIIALVAIVVRLLWVPISTSLPGVLRRRARANEPPPTRKGVFLVAWTSMRGIVSLATALALPTVLASGAPFPFRSEILVITVSVILVTLVVQGLTLAPIIRAFAFEPEQSHHVEARVARLEASRRGAEVLDDLSREAWVDPRDVEWLRNELRDRIRLLEHHAGEPEGRRRLRGAMLRAERRMLVRLRNEGAISDDVLRELEQELDLESVRVGVGEER